jgi:hypothetical protein
MNIKKILKQGFKILSLISIILTVIFLFYIFNLGKTPLQMKEYELSNGKQTIIFQEMVHIGESDFYEKLKERVRKYKDNGYVLAYEQVKIYTKEEALELQRLTGITVDLYGEMGKVLKVDNQSNHMDFITEKDINADLSGSELISLLKKHKKDNPQEKEDINSIFNYVKETELSDYNKNIAKILLRAILKIASDNADTFMEKGTYVQKVILSERDNALFNKVSEIKSNKILIHYGKFHYKGFLTKLKNKDSNWKVVTTKNYDAL